jgi:uncharacterized small protein (DUF1192 family)
MADINVKNRVTVKMGDKSYDLRSSGNPHTKLPKAVVDFLKENGHLADDVVVSAASGSSDLARMQAEIDRLSGALTTAEGERDAAQAEFAKADTALSEALAEIEKLKAPK